MEYIEFNCKSALNNLKNTRNKRLPYQWDLNIYRGCEHGCKYCFAMYSHAYLDDEKYFSRVYYKKKVIEYLEKELSSPKWKGEVINIGGITDSYQPIEKKLKLMPEVLKLMIKYKNPIIISTKSKLILRDLELIKELSSLTTVNIACTITAADENIRKYIEPNASSSIDRFKVLNKIKAETNAVVGVHLMPIIPYLTDNYNSLNAIYRTASKIKADYVLPGTLYLRGKTKEIFMSSIEKYDDELYLKLKEMYKKGSAGDEYKKGLYKNIYELQKKYNINANYMKAINDKIKSFE